MASAAERHPHVPAMPVLHSAVFALLGVEGLVFGGLTNFYVEIIVQRCGGEALTFVCCAVLL